MIYDPLTIEKAEETGNCNANQIAIWNVKFYRKIIKIHLNNCRVETILKEIFLPKPGILSKLLAQSFYSQQSKC